MQNLTADETRSLRCGAGMMIPASAAHNAPGADDDIVHGIGQLGMEAR